MEEFFEKHFNFSPLRLILVGLFLASIVAYLGYQRWELRFHPQYRKAVAPQEQPDGTIHYTLYHAEVNEGPVFYVPWKLAISKETYVSLPESTGSDRRTSRITIPNKVSFRVSNAPNISIQLYFNPKTMSFVTKEQWEKKSKDATRLEYISLYIRASLDNSTVTWLLDKDCNLGKELFTNLFELKSKDGKKSVFCDYVDDENTGYAYVKNGNILATGDCRIGCVIYGRFGRGYKIIFRFRNNHREKFSALVDATVKFIDDAAALESNPDLDRYAKF